MAGLRDMTIGDAYDTAKGKVQQGFEFAKGKAADAADYVLDKTRGARDAAVTPEAAATDAPTATGRAPAGHPDAVAYEAQMANNGNPVAQKPYIAPEPAVPTARASGMETGVKPGTLFNDGQGPARYAATGESPLKPAFQDPLADSNARIRAANNPYLRTDAGQQAVGRANDYFQGPKPAAAGGAGAPPQGPTTPGAAATEGMPEGIQRASAEEIAAKKGPGGIRGAFNTAGKLMKGAGIVGGGLAAFDAGDKASEGQTVEQMTGAPERNIENAVRGGFATFGDTMMMGQGRAAGQALGYGAAALVRPPVGTPAGVMGRIKAATTAAGEGWSEAKAAERANDERVTGVPQGARSAAPVPAGAQYTAQDSGNSAAAPTGAADNTEGLRTAEDIIRKRGVNDAGKMIQDGTGAIQVTRNGVKQPASFIDSRPSARAAEVQPTGGQRGVSPDAGGFVEGMLRIKGATAQDQREKDRAELGIKESANKIAAGRLGMEIGEKNKKGVSERIKAEALRNPEIAKLDPKEQERKATEMASDSASRLEYSLGRRNVGTENAQPAHINDFLDAEKWRRGVERGRATIGQKLRDYVGAKQHDSNDSFSYRPAFKVSTATGSKVYTENGNSVDMATASGGGFNVMGPNDPIDADMRRYVEGLPSREEYEAAQKKAKKGAK